MDEIELGIPLHDGKIAYGKLAGDWRNNPLIIFVHGFMGHAEELLIYLASRYFVAEGYSFLRFNLYDGRENARRMADCNLDIHATDVNSVVHFAKQHGATSVYLIGHSLGGHILAMADKTPLNGLILWDASHPTVPSINTGAFRYVAELDAYIYRGRGDYLLTSEYVRSTERFHLSNYLDGWIVPTLVMYAGGGILVDAGKMYRTLLHPYTEFYEFNVEGADHDFTHDEKRDTLFATTLAWLRSH